ncbi:hypothetical protein JKP88DRAFT_235330 [Tribonema minus]|uniref:Uncharacterized protein n=1 Tax=Tribonema minus TaxID=303371 RepID=A0A835Z4P6_9STRA|nr:hypothetical protein JKP88DRAFT_235330 [Tribonema minus]
MRRRSRQYRHCRRICSGERACGRDDRDMRHNSSSSATTAVNTGCDGASNHASVSSRNIAIANLAPAVAAISLREHNMTPVLTNRAAEAAALALKEAASPQRARRQHNAMTTATCSAAGRRAHNSAIAPSSMRTCDRGVRGSSGSQLHAAAFPAWAHA